MIPPTVLAAILTLTAALPPAQAAAAAPPSPESFWKETRELVLRCAVQPIELRDGREVAPPMQSTCPEVQLNELGARLELRDGTFFAYLEEARDSDGGDLFHVRVLNESRRVVTVRKNVLAFGDILLALAGSPEGIREERR
ncbi:MAG: hypothetical protein NDJ90_07645 [Oligoflexia bacterium]|nr:hypothetical protein [Oligoflexia bacterium]